MTDRDQPKSAKYWLFFGKLPYAQLVFFKTPFLAGLMPENPILSKVVLQNSLTKASNDGSNITSQLIFLLFSCSKRNLE